MNNLHLFNDNILQALGWTIIHSLWQIVLIGSLLKAGLWVFRKHAPEIRYHLLLAGLLSIVLIAVFTFFKIYDQPSNNASALKTVGNEVFPATQAFEISEPGVVAFDKSILTETRLLIQQNAHLITLFWLIGFLFFSIRFAGGYWFLSRIKKKSIPVNTKIQILAKNIGSKFNLNEFVKVFESVTVKVPIALGYLKPVIILPAGLATSIPFNQLEAILTHEMAHIKRNDFLVNLLKSMLEAVFFYHPVFWWIGKQLDNERENCCDDLTIELCKNETSLQEALFNIELHNQKLQHIAAALYKNKFQLLNRIKRMKSKNNLNHGNRITLAGLIVLPALLLIFSLSSAFVPREQDLPDFIYQNNRTVSEHTDLNSDASEPVNLVNNAESDEREKIFTEKASDPAAVPDTNEIKYGSKIKTDDGYVLMEFDESMNLQKITKDGKELTGADRDKYEKIAANSKNAYDSQIREKEHKKDLEKVQEKMKELQERMAEVQGQYNEVMKEYMEKAAFASDNLWPEVYANALDQNWYFKMDSLENYHFEMPEIEFPEIVMPELPETYFDEAQLQEMFEQAQAQYKEAMQNYNHQREEWWEERDVRKDARAQEEEARALERDARMLESNSNKLQNTLKTELINDGILKHWDDLKNFMLSDKKMEVNGKNQPKELQEKYLKLYKDLTGKELEGTLVINR
ncbi:MAG: M48 family metalloprotease [Bacteroidales bacterium]|nr:M48 family metalloprotease [Bacteroidales bacterium]